MAKPLSLDELAVVIRDWLIAERKRMVEPPPVSEELRIQYQWQDSTLPSKEDK